MRLLAESKRVVVATYNNSSLRIGIIDLNSPRKVGTLCVIPFELECGRIFNPLTSKFEK